MPLLNQKGCAAKGQLIAGFCSTKSPSYLSNIQNIFWDANPEKIQKCLFQDASALQERSFSSVLLRIFNLLHCDIPGESKTINFH